MRAIVQRVSEARVTIDGEVTGRCCAGLLLLVGVHRDDSEANARKLASKVANLRIFNNEAGKMNLSILDFARDGGGYARSVLAISNFTVYGETSKNRRPSFIESAGFERGQELFGLFLAELRSTGIEVETGRFGAHMEVALVNDGPVTVIVDA